MHKGRPQHSQFLRGRDVVLRKYQSRWIDSVRHMSNWTVIPGSKYLPVLMRPTTIFQTFCRLQEREPAFDVRTQHLPRTARIEALLHLHSKA